MLERIQSQDASAAAADLLDWAEAKEPVVRTAYDDERAAIRTSAGGLFRINQHEVRVSLSALRARWDDGRIRRLIDDLTEIDAAFSIDTNQRGPRPTAPLESLAEIPKRKRFLALMDESLAALTH